jgi:hypothetical protein
MLIRNALTVLTLATAGSAIAAVPQISCTGADDFKAVLKIEHGTGLGTLTYGYGDDLTTIEDLDTSFVRDCGAATKGNEVLFVVTPVGNKRVGQLILDGKTRILSCR